MQCPTCEVDLVMSDRNGIEIDYCPKCRGVWLDRGELDKIVERSAVGRPSVPVDDDDCDDDYRRGSNRDDRYTPPPPRKKSSFFSELFDFG